MSDLKARVDAGDPLALIAATAAERFDAGAEARVALVVADAEELREKAAKAVDAIEGGATASLADADIAFGFGAAREGRLAFVFPGQGSQYVGMGGAAAMTFDAARAIWDRAADLETFASDRLDRRVFPPPAFSDAERAEQAARLTEMQAAQPAIAAVSLGFLGCSTSSACARMPRRDTASVSSPRWRLPAACSGPIS